MFKRYASIVVGVILGNVLAAGLLWFSPAGNALGRAGGREPAVPGAGPADERAAAQAFQSTADELTPLGVGLADPGLVLSTPTPGETQVYFVATDNDATATVLYLYNTDTVAHIVPVRGFSHNGVPDSLNVNVGATSFLRLASDSIAPAPPPGAGPRRRPSSRTSLTSPTSRASPLPQGVRGGRLHALIIRHRHRRPACRPGCGAAGLQ
ncbi:MAG: hypothetical protein R2708_18095 [Vicinamibacterales bacterium]